MSSRGDAWRKEGIGGRVAQAMRRAPRPLQIGPARRAGGAVAVAGEVCVTRGVCPSGRHGRGCAGRGIGGRCGIRAGDCGANRGPGRCTVPPSANPGTTLRSSVWPMSASIPRTCG